MKVTVFGFACSNKLANFSVLAGDCKPSGDEKEGGQTGDHR